MRADNDFPPVEKVTQHAPFILPIDRLGCLYLICSNSSAVVANIFILKAFSGLLKRKEHIKPMTKQLCPYCGKPLEEGTFRSRGGNYYLPKDESAPLLYSKQAMSKKGAIPLLPDFLSSTPQWPIAYLCRNCKRIILPYD